MKLFFKLILLATLFTSCKNNNKTTFSKIMESSPLAEGKPEYLNSPYVTAGNRVYMVGHQDGSFPDLGWHIEGEMGGIWNHPIKLMDGFDIEIANQSDTFNLGKAKKICNKNFSNQPINFNRCGLCNLFYFQLF